MPIYEYSCAKCGKTIETIQRMSDKPLKTHAGCGGKLTKLISASGFQFKGTGWYVTDYARKGKTDGGDTAKETKPEAAKPAESAASTDTKTAASTGDSAAAKSEKPSKPAKTKSS